MHACMHANLASLTGHEDQANGLHIEVDADTWKERFDATRYSSNDKKQRGTEREKEKETNG
jgi:hypothetical protein